MNILIIGGTGTVGRNVVDLLLERGVRPHVLVRSRDRVRALPPGAAAVVGDIQNVASLRRAMRGVDRLFLITPHSRTEGEDGVGAVQAAKENAVDRIVYMSAHRVDEAPDSIPHLASKKIVQRAIAESGIDHTIIKPNNFFQNDENWFAEPILRAGIYPQPIGSVGLSRVDVGDIAESVVRVLLEDGHHGRQYGLAGPDVLTGERTAEIWSNVLGRTIQYAGDDVAVWAAGVKGSMPDWLLDDFVKMYLFFQRAGVTATTEDLADIRRLLGREPKSFATYAAEVARKWKEKAA